jgi:hypothetical protein
MKTKFVFVSTLIILLNAAWIVPLKSPPKKVSQVKAAVKPSGHFSFFRTHRQGREGVAATWGVPSTQGVSGFILQKTYEFPDEYATWENVYEVNCNGSRSYGFLDVSVYPGEVSYRVLAMNGTVTSFVSGISAVLIRQR